MDTIQSKIEKHQKILTEYINNLAEEKNDSIGVDFKHFAIVDTYEYQYRSREYLDMENDTEIPIDVELAQQYGVIKKYLTVG